MAHTLYSQQFKNIPAAKDLKKFNEICKKSAHVLQSEIKASELAAIDAIFAETDLKEFTKLAKKIAFYEKVLVLGVGGSSLGGKTLTALKCQNKLEFLESIDPATIQNCLAKIDLRNTFFLVISKSGETIETICQSLIILAEIEKAKIQNFAAQFLFITESITNSLAKIAQKIGAEIAFHPNKIGGRYSCFSIVGILPAMLAGLDGKKIRDGAKKILDNFLTKSDITNSCATQLALYEQGFTSNVIMPYIDSLKNFTDWYRQLWAESLGKTILCPKKFEEVVRRASSEEGVYQDIHDRRAAQAQRSQNSNFEEHFGSVPINSMGTIDQHSQLQLYLEGPKDKFFTFITAKNHPQDFAIKDLVGCATLFGGKKLSEIVKVEQETTIEVLNRKKLPIRIFEIEKLDEEVLGGLMMQMFLEVILIARAKGINPFDQPAVELRKNLAKKILSEA
jgi:glucose-6-phosphate isomerase